MSVSEGTAETVKCLRASVELAEVFSRGFELGVPRDAHMHICSR